MKEKSLLNKHGSILRVDESGIQLINKTGIAAAKKVARGKNVTRDRMLQFWRTVPSISYLQRNKIFLRGGGGLSSPWT
jgi:hypothetical protein